ncbi:MAG: PQQ-dependent sugar dehydrogenase [Patescibacteria group bacterium]
MTKFGKIFPTSDERVDENTRTRRPPSPADRRSALGSEVATKGLISFIFLLGIVILLTIVTAFFFRDRIFRVFYEPTITRVQEGGSKESITEIIADNLQIPWEIAFLPDGDLLVTERSGTLKRIGKEGRVYTIEGVKHVGEGGLLGMALHPRFRDNRLVYLYLTTATGNGLKNRVERYRLEDNRLSEKKVIIDNIPGAAYHDGGRIAFGGDGYLYITTGDASNAEFAQNIDSLAGKILRLKDDGSVPDDNPFTSTGSAQAAAVYSYGHRNSQGLVWDDRGRLWATEHGRSGILSGFDELNLIEKGKNYGWPIIEGDEKKEGMETPLAQSGPDETWAPSSIAFWNGSFFFGGLRGESLYEAKIIGEKQISLKVHFRKEFGRIRAVVLGPDGFLYITTSNTDGRGNPKVNDDKIIRLNPLIFREP